MDSRLRGNEGMKGEMMTADFADEFRQRAEQIEATLARIERQLDHFLSQPPVDVNVNANYGAVQHFQVEPKR
jgi:hypothetical protein